eukprot:CAMPEP_0181325174 /NCGR_PEP_ID=MMETSP1101-20121128/20778_1 /TAXON_ID=46948 /ORGANISM="Rhodomonas abbreviata, Strain Caron Lab Isolate" /LENGTH=339 /DNA_ID=CAMNT_0023433451 /DNA_START=155 /DNA_END=1171 /DNA_ORIENTATION=+
MFENVAQPEGPVKPAGGAARRWGANKTPSTAELIKKMADNDASLTTVDISNSAIFQLKAEEYTNQLADALRDSKYVKEVRLENCGLGDKEGKILGDMLASNTSVTLLDLQKNKINNDGGSALAKGLTHNKSLICLDLMSMAKTRWGDKCLDDFLAMFDHNITLLKINWRLESRKSFALNKMLTRNNEIDRRKKSGMPYEDILPTALKTPGAGGESAPAPAPAPAAVQVPPAPEPVPEPAAEPVSETETTGDKENAPPGLSGLEAERPDDTSVQAPEVHRQPTSPSFGPSSGGGAAAGGPWGTRLAPAGRAPSGGSGAGGATAGFKSLGGGAGSGVGTGM